MFGKRGENIESGARHKHEIKITLDKNSQTPELLLVASALVRREAIIFTKRSDLAHTEFVLTEELGICQIVTVEGNTTTIFAQFEPVIEGNLVTSINLKGNVITDFILNFDEKEIPIGIVPTKNNQ